MGFTFRPYQTVASDEIFEAIQNPDMGDSAYGMATGAGKSIIVADVANRVLNESPRDNIVMLAPSKELIGQNYKKLCTYFPPEMIGIMCSSYGRNDRNRPLTIASIKSLQSRGLTRVPKTVLIDECYSADTEILTTEGWKLFPDLEDSDRVAQFDTETETTSWVIPLRVINKDYTGPMINFKSLTSTDLMVTPEHHMLVKDRHGNYQKLLAKDLVLENEWGIPEWCITREPVIDDHQGVVKTTVNYSGKVYCCTVPTGNVVVRRNGKASICGNCHLVNTVNKGQYREYIQYCKENNRTKVMGLSATLYTGTGIWLNAGSNPLFETLMLNPQCQMKALVEKGWLAPLKEVTIPIKDKIKPMKGMTKNSQGEYSVKKIEQVVDPFLEDRVEKSLVYADQLNVSKVMCVTASILHAERVAAKLRELGQSVSIVHSKSDNRDYNVSNFLEGSARFIITVVALTTGFDAPALEMIVNFRHIGSKVLYVQVGGRGTRPHEYSDGTSKPYCWFLDWTDTTEVMGPIDQVTGKVPRGKAGETPTKQCPGRECTQENCVGKKDLTRPCPRPNCNPSDCGWRVPAVTQVCPNSKCRHQFEFSVNVRELLNIASGAPVMSIDPEKHKAVDNWTVEKHTSTSGAQSIKITFKLGDKVVFREYIAFHPLGDNKKPKRIWRLLRGGDIVPESFNAAWLRRINLKCPSSIQLEFVRKKLQLSGALYREDKIDDKSDLIQPELFD